MATTVVSFPLPQPHEHVLTVDNPTEARKRRREKLASQRIATSTPDAWMSSNSSIVEAANKKRKVEVPTSSPAIVSPTIPEKKGLGAAKATGKTKKPQMKYDPDVPMNREEAAAWRREQRRKRNRESAAASRQRQRDRIIELEAEVEGWKSKFEDVMNRIRQLEEAQENKKSGIEDNKPVMDEGINSPEPMQQQLQIDSPEALVEAVFRDTIMVSPNSSPRYAPRSVSPPSPSSSADFPVVNNVKKVTSGANQVNAQEAEEEPQPSKMISRPA